jgi:predicted dehydrogenase
VFRRFYASIENADAEPEYPQFADGLRQLTILEAELESHRRHAWEDVR